MTTYGPGSVIRARNRLWCVDGRPEDDVLVASTIDGGDARRVKFYVPFEDIEEGHLARPSPDIVEHIQSQDLLLETCQVCWMSSPASRRAPKARCGRL